MLFPVSVLSNLTIHTSPLRLVKALHGLLRPSCIIMSLVRLKVGESLGFTLSYRRPLCTFKDKKVPYSAEKPQAESANAHTVLKEV